jgi:endonuclease YncB( thermonuclease family)
LTSPMIRRPTSRAAMNLCVIRTLCHGLIIVLCLVPRVVSADDRSTDLVVAFMKFCTREAPDFERIDAAAHNLDLRVESETGPIQTNGRLRHFKNWSVEDRTGSFELRLSEERRGPANEVEVVMCGVTASDANGEEIRNDLTTALRLDLPTMESVAMNGSEQYVAWRKQIDEEWLEIVLAYASPPHLGIDLVARVAHRACAAGTREAIIGRPDRPQAVSFGGAALVIDGGSLDVCGIPVHLDGLTAPRGNESLAAEAKETLRAIIGKSGVICTESGNQLPNQVRGECILSLGGDVGELLIRAGYAIACPGFEQYIQVEKDARARQTGMWQHDPPPALSCS